MSSPEEQKQAIGHSVMVAERRLTELNAKPKLTRAELFEKDMTVDCIIRGNKLLGHNGTGCPTCKGFRGWELPYGHSCSCGDHQ